MLSLDNPVGIFIINLMETWPTTIEEAARLRDELARGVILSASEKEISTIAGVDVAYRGGISVAASVLYDLETLECLEETTAVEETRFPYIPGYLFFREAPAVTEALKKLSRRPDLLMVDGHGIAHPKRSGYACLLGVLLDTPSVGCAKSRLVGKYEEPAMGRGAWSPLTYRLETVGAVVRTRQAVRPVFVSPGHLITLEESIAVVLRCSPRYRVPEPLRKADALAKKTLKLPDHSLL